MKDIVNYWEEEWLKITDFTNVTSKDDLMLEQNTNLKEVIIVVTNRIVDKYEARSYPNDDFNNNGKIELYEVDVFEILIRSTDYIGTFITKKYKAPRFMPYWNDPQNPIEKYKSLGWINAGLSKARNIIVSRFIANYEVSNRYSPGRGAIVLEGAFYIHAGPSSIDEYGFGSAGCIEIIGDFDDFKSDIHVLSGFSGKSSDDAISELIRQRKLKVIIEEAKTPDIKTKFTREI